MEHRASHKGKEGHHILSDEVTVDHTKRIIAATKGFKRALNNKTVGKLEIQLIHTYSGYRLDSLHVLSPFVSSS